MPPSPAEFAAQATDAILRGGTFQAVTLVGVTQGGRPCIVLLDESGRVVVSGHGPEPVLLGSGTFGPGNTSTTVKDTRLYRQQFAVFGPVTFSGGSGVVITPTLGSRTSTGQGGANYSLTGGLAGNNQGGSIFLADVGMRQDHQTSSAYTGRAAYALLSIAVAGNPTTWSLPWEWYGYF